MSKETEETPKKQERKEERKEENKKRTKSVVVAVRKNHKSALNEIYVVLAEINKRLVEIQGLLEDAQYKKHGSVTLSLTRCREELCLGCPHSRWDRWVVPKTGGQFSKSATSKKSTATNKFFAVKVNSPKMSVSKGKAAKDHRAGMLVAEAVNLLERRANIVQKLSYLLRYIRNTEV